MAEHYALLSAIISDAAFWVGLTTVAVFAAGRFNERRVDTEKDLDPPLTAHCFTTRFRFNSALVMYVLVYCGFYGALIFGFSFEVFQNFFKEFFGPITLPGEGMEFGTPAWVATLVPILVSTTPWFRQRDELFRRWLWAFSGVPQTAQAFANELVSVAAQRLPPMRPDHLEPLRLSDSFAVYEVLRLIENRLRERFDDYKDFLYQHEALSRSLSDTHEALRHSVASDADHAAQIQDAQAALAEALRPDDGEPARVEVDMALERLRGLLHAGEADGPEVVPDTPLRLAAQNLVVRRARFMSCGLLTARRADYLARENVNDIVVELLEEGTLDIEQLGGREQPFRMRMPPFRFGYLQLVAGFVAVLMAVLVCGVAREIVLPVLDDRPLGQQIWSWLVFSPFVALAFSLPLIPAAALRYFLTDMKYRQRRRLTFEHYLLALVVNGVASMLLATIVLLALGVLVLSRWSPDFDVLVLVPWSLPMAACSVLFMLMSQVTPTRSGELNRVVDAAIFALVGAGTGMLGHAGSLLVNGRAETVGDLALLGDPRALGLAVVVGTTSAVLGLTQCQSSRRGLLAHADRRTDRHGTWTTAIREAPTRLLRGAGMVSRQG